MGANPKTKGANGERELAAIWSAWAKEAGIDLDLTRNLEQTRGGGHDLVGTEAYGIAPEVKRQEAYTMTSWWAQAVRQGEKAGCIPVLAWRQNRKPWKYRVRVWCYPCDAPLDVDLEEAQFKKWFIATLKRGKINDTL